MTAMKAAQALNADAEVEKESQVRELAKKLVQRAQKAGANVDKRTRKLVQRAQKAGANVDKRTRIAVTALSKCRDPTSTHQSKYSVRRIAQMYSRGGKKWQTLDRQFQFSTVHMLLYGVG
jgi:hypothetical protein